MKKKKIALLGGAFNPITKGHIQIAEFVLSNSDIEQLWITPCYGHAFNKEMVDFKHRLEMCEIASKDNSKIKVFDYEIRHKLENGTYDFLKRLKKDKSYKAKRKI